MDSFATADFSTPEAAMEALERPLKLQTLTDTNVLRALLFLLHFGLVQIPHVCSVKGCKGQLLFEEQYRQADNSDSHKNPSVRYQTRCTHCGDRRAVVALGVLAFVRQNHWFAFCHFLFFVLCRIRWTQMLKVMVRKHSLGARGAKDALPKWLRYVQMAQRGYLKANSLLKIGGRSYTVVWDETSWGKDKGVSKTAQKPIGRSLPGRIKSRKPAQTIWNKGFKKRFKKSTPRKRGPKADSPTRWVWLAVLVGKGSQVFTHANRLKRISFRLLPKKGDAKMGKPRGTEEISDTVKQCIAKGTKRAVTDCWRASGAAAKRQKLGGDKHKVVNHKKEWRNADGFHTNDVESENNRIKNYLARPRYGRLPALKDDLLLYEYAFYVNVGDSITHLADAMRHFANLPALRPSYPAGIDGW